MESWHLRPQHKWWRRMKILYLSLFVFWFFISLVLWYQYLLFSADKWAGRWGTFVEAISTNVSYLPYWWTTANDVYYQGLLFPSCLTYNWTWYQDNLCKVSTDDNVNFVVDVIWDKKWSDDREVTVDDVFFTYNELVRNNFWKIWYLDAYSALKILKKDDWTIHVEFPFASVDNLNFFTQYILPKHIVDWMNLEQYKTDFARNPVYGWCARISEKSKDISSFVLEMDGCDFTSILYYQLKYFWSNAEFETYNKEWGSSVIGLYNTFAKQPWFNEYKVLTDKYMTIFFNNESKQLNKDIKRELWWYINSHIYTWDFENYFFKDQLLFETFWSNWSNLEHQIINKNPNLDVSKDGLESLNINKIPNEIVFSWTKEKQVYYLDIMPESGKFAVYLKSAKKYDSLIITQNDWTWTNRLPFIDSNNRYQFTLDISTNIKEWLNKYAIKWYNKDKIETLADIDIYYLNLPAVNEDNKQEYIAQKWKIKVIYFMDDATRFVAKKFEEILKQSELDQYFYFVWYEKSSEFDAKLLSKDYDVVISQFDFARKKDFSSFLLTDVATINPSLYTNQNMASYISDYVHQKGDVKESLKLQINDIYANDMPFVVLGQIVNPYYLSSEYSILSWWNVYSVEELKDELLRNIEISSNLRLDKNKVLSWTVMQEFVKRNFE